ncbi:putative ABC transport system permease protein [Micromonospora kangleipakensis]|uniref:Putative ABC transport system permease protein n=1 Tax=Micromonospora kangleipakensis TaxID=1077942 RepID=A0A4Q8BH62_9ACTN|nr:ABC transporter permease [Micromonospora kangleipakensis]RZU76811.1 putative ABC transport system permease protein [Micromonospora kangleipakensis]
MSAPPRPGRLSPGDVLRAGAAGLRSRRLRVFLSALGIAIGIAAMIAVVGISSSSQAELDRQLDELGTNLLTVEPGRSLDDKPTHLPDEAIPMIARIASVEAVSAVGRLPNVHAYRNEHVHPAQTGSLAVYAGRLDLPETVGLSPVSGRWLSQPTADFPTAVLGWTAAQRLGIDDAAAQPQIVLGKQRFTVVGVLRPAPLAEELDRAVLVGWSAATAYLGFDGHATTVYTRTAEDAVVEVRKALPRTVKPTAPSEVLVSRPSDALAAKTITENTFSGLLLGLGAVALLVGGIGVTNTMVISVLERRSEIGLRRALGATRGQILLQFLVESLLLSALGGLGGILIGVVVTGGYAATQDWPAVVPLWATAGGFASTLLIGAVAGLYPAVRAARLTPTEALAGV